MQTQPHAQEKQGGVLVRRVEPTAPLSKFLARGDVILSFDGVDVGSDGASGWDGSGFGLGGWRRWEFPERGVWVPG